MYTLNNLLTSNAIQTRYPVNCLRNLAITNARTSTVFLVDVDMIPSFEMRQYLQYFLKIVLVLIKRIEIPLLKLTSPPKSVFVVPTFSTEIFDPNARLPTTKTELITVQRKQQVSVVSKNFENFNSHHTRRQIMSEMPRPHKLPSLAKIRFCL